MFQILKNQIRLSFSESVFRGCFHMEAAAVTSKAAFTFWLQLLPQRLLSNWGFSCNFKGCFHFEAAAVTSKDAFTFWLQLLPQRLLSNWGCSCNFKVSFHFEASAVTSKATFTLKLSLQWEAFKRLARSCYLKGCFLFEATQLLSWRRSVVF